jgi:hypothetical protein
MNNLTIYYRLSDKGNNKDRLEIINNKSCLLNFIQAFRPEQMVVIADNVTDETMSWLETFSFGEIHRTSLGNSGSFWYSFQLAIKLAPSDFVYFVENDYIHRTDSEKILMEGLKIADYVTLYDHSDKYVDGINPRVKNGGEKTKVFLTASTHWKMTNSTTMTFASKVDILRKDQFFFRFFSVGIIKKGFPVFKILQGSNCPHDYYLFITLGDLKKRKIISPIPGYSTHGEKKYLSPLIDWNLYL